MVKLHVFTLSTRQHLFRGQKILLTASPFVGNCLMPQRDEVPGIRLVVFSRVRFRLAPKNCLMRVLRTGGTIDEFLLGTVVIVFSRPERGVLLLWRRRFRNNTRVDNNLSESSERFHSCNFLLFVRYFIT